MNPDAQKRAAAARVIEFVRPGMRLGLGTGSTAKHFVELLGEGGRVLSRLSVIDALFVARSVVGRVTPTHRK